MEQRISLVTLGVKDLARARAFYEVLGWGGAQQPDDEIAFFQAGGMVFGLWTALALAGIGGAQERAAPPAAKASAPPLMACGVHGDIEVLCGTRSPEDLEITPDGKYLIATQFVNGRGGSLGLGMALFDLAKKTYTKIPATAEPDKSWGDASCPGPIGDALPLMRRVKARFDPAGACNPGVFVGGI